MRRPFRWRRRCREPICVGPPPPPPPAQWCLRVVRTTADCLSISDGSRSRMWSPVVEESQTERSENCWPERRWNDPNADPNECLKILIAQNFPIIQFSMSIIKSNFSTSEHICESHSSLQTLESSIGSTMASLRSRCGSVKCGLMFAPINQSANHLNFWDSANRDDVHGDAHFNWWPFNAKLIACLALVNCDRWQGPNGAGHYRYFSSPP